MTIRLAVLISGGGTTLLNLIDRIGDGRLEASIEVVVSSRADAGGIDRARRAGIPTVVVPTRRRSVEDYSRETFDICRQYRVELAILGGYLSLLRIPDDFAGRTMNIHPALVPLFCGKGYYGLRVHQAVLESGVQVTGCTVHFVDNEYDHGPIILQQPVAVHDDDTPETLAARVFEAECAAYPEAIRLFAEGRLSIDGRRVRRR